MPRTSVMQFIVLAVKMPAQEPQPGQASCSIWCISSGVIWPDSTLPAASNMVLTLISFPLWRPASMGPPLTTTVGILMRPAAMSMPGTILSQLGIMTSPSKAWPLATASMESQMSSRLASGYFMPSWPMAMPSQMPMAGNSIGVPPAAAMPSLTASAISRRCIWPGMISLKALTTPINGFCKSSSL